MRTVINIHNTIKLVNKNNQRKASHDGHVNSHIVRPDKILAKIHPWTYPCENRYDRVYLFTCETLYACIPVVVLSPL